MDFKLSKYVLAASAASFCVFGAPPASAQLWTYKEGLGELKTFVTQTNAATLSSVPCAQKACKKAEKRIRKKFKKLYVEPLQMIELKAAQAAQVHGRDYKGVTAGEWNEYRYEILPLFGKHHESVTHLCQAYGPSDEVGAEACALSQEIKTRILPAALAPYHKAVIKKFKDENKVESVSNPAEDIWYELTHYPAGRGRTSGYNYTKFEPIVGEKIPMSIAFSADVQSLLKLRTERIEKKQAEDAYNKQKAAERAAAEEARRLAAIKYAEEKAERLLSQCRVELDGVTYALRPNSTEGNAEVIINFQPASVDKDGLTVPNPNSFILQATSEKFDSEKGLPRFESVRVHIDRPRIAALQYGYIFGKSIEGIYADFYIGSEHTYRSGRDYRKKSGNFTVEQRRDKYSMLYGNVLTGGPYLNWLGDLKDRRNSRLTLRYERDTTWVQHSTNYSKPTVTSGLEVKEISMNYRKPASFRLNEMRKVFSRLKDLNAAGGCQPI